VKAWWLLSKFWCFELTVGFRFGTAFGRNVPREGAKRPKIINQFSAQCPRCTCDNPVRCSRGLSQRLPVHVDDRPQLQYPDGSLHAPRWSQLPVPHAPWPRENPRID
jgi:hypothetical protein